MKKGKMVYCQETFQVFPSAKIAAEHHGVNYVGLVSHLSGKYKTYKNKHFVYVENTADLSQLFTSKMQEEREREAMRRKAEDNLNKLIEADKSAREAQKEIASKLAEARRIVKKYM